MIGGAGITGIWGPFQGLQLGSRPGQEEESKKAETSGMGSREKTGQDWNKIGQGWGKIELGREHTGAMFAFGGLRVRKSSSAQLPSSVFSDGRIISRPLDYIPN